jgi:predicted ArsR family transcriptional regulator
VEQPVDQPAASRPGPGGTEAPGSAREPQPGDHLAVHKALGDETRLAIYRELSTTTYPLAVTELAERLGLHPNTVRPHLERLRDAGIVAVEAVHRGTPGRPQHRYSLAPGAPSPGLEPDAATLLAGLLAALVERVGGAAPDAVATGRAWGEGTVARVGPARAADALVAEMGRLGFEPAPEPVVDGTHVAFLRCPLKELAEAYPELVCSLHQGLCEGVVGASGTGRVVAFHDLYDRDRCSVVVGHAPAP